MKLLSSNIENEAEQAIRSILENIPDLKDIRISRETRIKDRLVDLQITFRRKNVKQTLLVEVKSSGQPRYARAAVNQLLNVKSENPDAYGVFIAPYISETTAELCRNNGIGYVDLAGNSWLNFDSVFIEIKGNPNRFSEKRDLKSLFKPKAERILRVLLSEPRRLWLTEEMAETANVSLGQVSNVRKLLLEREWIADKKRGIELTEPLELLNSWLENYQPDRNIRNDFYFMGSIGEIELLIGNICKQTQTRYSFTGFSGAARYAPFTTYKTITLYMDPLPSINEDIMPFKAVTTGANIRILSPYDEGVFYGTRSIQGGMVASPVQCYLDLKDEKARGEEAAEALLEKEIKPSW
ncbi:MAG: type IV toxin-antitoxin system AbiEi family antitoxin [bacterium]